MIEIIKLEGNSIKTIIEGREEEIYRKYEELICERNEREDIKIKDTEEGITVYKYF